ncbi:butyrophilin subfamily 2 member A1-like [Lepidochelys kempii]|uniref:butyrophilin subfamily 2 member A1-like n=1 Tax=Lepidochelys kempii TaxID=8472 RepID=UPI003C6FF935
MTFSVPWTAAIQMLVLVLGLHSTAGNSHEPLIVLDNYEDNGIRVTCFSERRFSDVQVLWTDSKGHNLTGSPITPTSNTDEASAKSSILLKSGSGNAISCNIIDNVLETSTESTVVIADVFFPATSPWMTAFIVILLISIALVIAAIYKLKKNNETTAQAVNDKKSIEDEIRLLTKELDTEHQNSQQEIQAIQEKFEKAMAELDFRRARSNAVNITLDSDCKHPKLSLKDKNRVISTAEKKACRDLIVVANEGFSEKKQYWEVEVGDKPEWELGVLTENERGKLKNEKMEKPPEKEYWSLRLSEGQYHCSWKSDTITSEDKKCPVVGIFLDWEEGMISFYNVALMCPVVSITQDFQRKLYPFFNPGNDNQYLGIRPLSVPSPLTSL